MTACVCVYLCMPLLHSAFRPHTYQLHSISCSSEADRLAGPCYITTLHSIYNLLCVKPMCTHTSMRNPPTYHGKNHSSLHVKKNIHTSIYINYTWCPTHTFLPPLPSLPSIIPPICSKSISVQGIVVRHAPCQ